MKPTNPARVAGAQLRRIRKKLGLTMRDVEEISEAIADEHKSANYVLSKSWVAALESGKGHMPTLARLYSLGAIYKRSFKDLALIFDVPFQDLGKDQGSYGVPKTSLVAEGNDEGDVSDRAGAVVLHAHSVQHLDPHRRHAGEVQPGR